ncbi:hypothetical protein [Nonomuraea diastatica]|uniref:Uncharacterized protein n=1 Tax=Nonomuraea diastatica TaxID=1848329 RepID=A0A4R4W803_9ACTN|nr:hypothetical protein [Nonomuraea diastatica]TDD13157.1 hypothetical protein E1294_42020 [Nonomuraea diastatica]
MIIRTPNPTDDTPVHPPQRSEGGYYDIEIIYDAGRWRLYADSPAEILGVLLPGYQQEDPHRQEQRRIRAAVDVQVALQAQLNVDSGALAQCTAEQRAILLGDRDQPPSPATWTAPVPLVLVTTFYAPGGALTRPAGTDDAMVWLDPSTEWSLLESLAAAGWIGLARRDPSTPDIDT